MVPFPFFLYYGKGEYPMFIDVAKIKIKAGDGGNGAVSFHREKFVSAGGPDGGDGGWGGNIVFKVDTNLSTLADFRYKRKYNAENGQNGGAGKCFGKNGKDLIITVPKGTLVKDVESGRLLADVSEEETPYVVAKGGRGGWGNSHFATATRQAPRFAKSGLPGQGLEVQLELKLLADVGLLGFPNVGKSTLISVVSEAKPKIANYHFTTITPTLGVVRMGEGSSFVMADIPGLIEGAGEGVGLGHQFLRHVERCRLLVHILDVSGSEGRDPIEDFEAINKELSVYSPELSTRPQIVAGNKTDMATPEQLARVREYMEEKGYEYFDICAPICEGTQELVNRVAAVLQTLPPILTFEADPVPVEELIGGKERFTVTEENGTYVVEAEFLKKIMATINPEDYESLQYFQRVLHTSGIIQALIDAGCGDGDTVCIYDIEFDYVS